MLKIKSNDNKNPNYEKALKDIQQDNLIVLSFLLPKSLRDSFKIKVIENKTTMVSVLTDYIEEYVGK